MNTSAKTLYSKLLHIPRRFINVEVEQKNKPQWRKPVGYETDITMYNPVTKSTVPLILNKKGILTWYICGPTVYDSAHIGHAVTYMKCDIIRRILSDYFNINVVTAMCITDIDDKIIKRSKEKKQDFQVLTRHYENEFFEDMTMLNVMKPHLHCRVTDYVPEIIQFIKTIISCGGAYVAKGSVYFDTNKHETYGKLSAPVADSRHPDKKSSLDFTLWKSAKEGEPYWESPWGFGRPGWHIECSAIASTVFGSSIDIHSGGIDLVFPHHENEEAQSCCYHKVDQWVNYWLHCGHLYLDDEVKMSKSLKNTISIREFLKNYSSNHLRILCLLSNYRNGIKFSEKVMQNAVAVLNKIEHFFNDCDNYIVGRWSNCNVDENVLLECLNETQNNVSVALANNFDTARAMQSLMKLVDVGIKMLHDENKASTTRNIAAIAAVSSYLSDTFTKFGVLHAANEDHRIESLIEHFVSFRSTVRNRALEQETKDKALLTACDEARHNLSMNGVLIKDVGTNTMWSIKKY